MHYTTSWLCADVRTPPLIILIKAAYQDFYRSGEFVGLHTGCAGHSADATFDCQVRYARAHRQCGGRNPLPAPVLQRVRSAQFPLR
jgi:hypothetical protein